MTGRPAAIWRMSLSTENPDDVTVKLEHLGIRRGTYKLEPIGRIHKVIATRLTEAARDIPTFPLLVDINVDELLAQRAQFNQAQSARVSVNDLMVKAAAIALKEVPGVNSSFTPYGMVRHHHADIGRSHG